MWGGVVRSRNRTCGRTVIPMTYARRTGLSMGCDRYKICKNAEVKDLQICKICVVLTSVFANFLILASDFCLKTLCTVQPQ